MKKLLLFSAFFATFFGVTQVSAQLRDTVYSTVKQGYSFELFGTGGYIVPAAGTVAPVANAPALCRDSLQVSDTLAAVIPFDHTNSIDFFLRWYWLKVGSGTATITASFYESNEGANWTPVIKGVLDSAYVRTFTLSASGWSTVDFRTDTARFAGRYLKVQLMTSSTASVGGRVYMLGKSNIQ